MFKLPNLPSQVNKNQKHILEMRGVNFSDSFQDGELSDCLNLTADRFPYLSVRKGRTQYGDYIGASGVFSWGSHVVVINNGAVIYDGQQISSLSPGEKQFTVVNSKLIIFPDKRFIDLESGEFDTLETTMSFSSAEFKSATTFTGNGKNNLGQRSTEIYGLTYFNHGHFVPGIMGYGSDISSISFNHGTKQWTLPAGTRYYLPYNEGDYSVNIPVGTIIMLAGDVEGTEPHAIRVDVNGNEEETYNTRGYFGIVTEKPTQCSAWVKDYISGDWFNAGGRLVTYDLYQIPENAKLADSFKVGDGITILGADDNDREKAIVTAIDRDANTITFGAESFAIGLKTDVTLKKNVPDLDFICECENRLWGVSSADKTIYASALGLPGDFWDYRGLSTDSYAVAVGSEGDFTGLAALSGNVLAFKEKYMHKIIGSYPADYQINTYTLTGVQKGSHKSMKVMDEVLFYKGVDGVYVYSGGSPSKISYNFGNRRFSNASAGIADGKYYISMKDMDSSEYSLFVYDTNKGLWHKEDDSEVIDFANNNGRLYFCCRDGKVYVENPEEPSDEKVKWSATFTPFYESYVNRSYVDGRKLPSTIHLRVEIPKGSWMKVEYRLDNGLWQEAVQKPGTIKDNFVTVIKPMRCDKYEIRLSGVGPCTVLQMVREFRQGSTV